MLSEGMQALQVAAYGTTTVIPTMQSAVKKLGAPESGINPQWVVNLSTNGSAGLASAIRLAPHEPVSNALTRVQNDLSGIVAAITDAVRVNSLRQTAWPETLTAKFARIAQAQATILNGLQELDFFVSGDPDQLLR
jgi:hypothetical protein